MQGRHRGTGRRTPPRRPVATRPPGFVPLVPAPFCDPARRARWPPPARSPAEPMPAGGAGAWAGRRRAARAVNLAPVAAQWPERWAGSQLRCLAQSRSSGTAAAQAPPLIGPLSQYVAWGRRGGGLRSRPARERDWLEACRAGVFGCPGERAGERVVCPGGGALLGAGCSLGCGDGLALW